MLASVPSSAQCPDGSPPPCSRPALAAAIPTLAVLPLTNLSGDSSQAFLAAGLTEELTSRLGEVARIRVSGSSVVQRAQHAGEHGAIAGVLKVQYLLEGSVRTGQSLIRVSVRLLRVKDGIQVWAATFNRSDSDIITLQDAVAREVVERIAGTLLPRDRALLGKPRTADPVAYQHYLRGLDLRRRGIYSEALAEFEAALRRDPAFAAAEARRAGAYASAFLYGHRFAPPDSLLTWGLAAADRALRLDSTLAEAWHARGHALTNFNRDMAVGRLALERAVRLDRDNTEFLHWFVVNLKWSGLDSLAGVASRDCLALDPRHSLCVHSLAEVLLLGGRRSEAAALFDSALAVGPEEIRPRLRRAGIRYARGDLTGAAADIEAVLRVAPPSQRPHAVSWLAGIAAASGDSARARRLLASIESPAVDYARALVLLGQRDSALAVLARVTPGAMAATGATYRYEVRFPEFASLHGDPRFQAVVAGWLRP